MLRAIWQKLMSLFHCEPEDYDDRDRIRHAELRNEMALYDRPLDRYERKQDDLDRYMDSLSDPDYDYYHSDTDDDGIDYDYELAWMREDW
jgi:hypothetical protein